MNSNGYFLNKFKSPFKMSRFSPIAGKTLLNKKSHTIHYPFKNIARIFY